MSLILEALRKSEAERRRGQAPDLYSELPPTARFARPRRAAWPWLSALAILAAAAALTTAWLTRDRHAPTSIAVEGLPMERAPLQSMPTQSADESRPEQLPEQHRSAPQATSTATPVEPATSAPQPSSTVTPEPTSTPPQQPEPTPSAPPVRDITRSPAAPVATAPPATTTPAPRPITPPAPVLPAAPPPAPVAAPTAPQTATTTPADKRAPMSLAALPAAERRALPPLQISMHVWAPTAAGRFAIIDGERVNEGDRLGNAVVEEITRDGVVLSWHGRRVQIPIQ